MGTAMLWKRIRLELGRTEAFANGSRHHGYDLVAPLDTDGVIGEDDWAQSPARATVRRFWAGEDDARGQLARAPDGGWAFSFPPGDDGALHRFDARAFKVGDAVTVVDGEGAARPFRVAAVRVLASA